MAHHHTLQQQSPVQQIGTAVAQVRVTRALTP